MGIESRDLSEWNKYRSIQSIYKKCSDGVCVLIAEQIAMNNANGIPHKFDKILKKEVQKMLAATHNLLH